MDHGDAPGHSGTGDPDDRAGAELRREREEREREREDLDREREDLDRERIEVAAAGAERLTFFSDAVVAIALTLLALDLPTPDGFTGPALWRALGDHTDAYLAFVLSFAVIAAHWMTHHDIFPWLNRTDRVLRLLNMAWLFTIVITPFATRIVSEGGKPPGGALDTSQPQRFAMYAMVQVATDVVFVVMVWWSARGNLMRLGTPRAIFSEGYRGGLSTGLGFALSIPLFFVWHSAWVMWIVVPPAYGLVRRGFAGRSRGAGEPRPG